MIEYGLVKELIDGCTIWYEPITDLIDAFVLRGPNQEILDVYKSERN